MPAPSHDLVRGGVGPGDGRAGERGQQRGVDLEEQALQELIDEQWPRFPEPRDGVALAYERRSRQRDAHEDDQDPRGHQVDDERRTRQTHQPQAAEERKGAEPRLQHGGDHRHAGGDIQALEGPQHPAGGLGKHRGQKAEVEHPAGQGGLVRELQGVMGRAVDRGDERQPGDPQPQAQEADGPQRGAGGARERAEDRGPRRC